jgi:hypothetical protein
MLAADTRLDRRTAPSAVGCGLLLIIDVIRSGSVIGQAPIVSMPHRGGIIPASQLRALVAYIKTLKTA